jgi:lysophospholipase L1-like esterase
MKAVLRGWSRGIIAVAVVLVFAAPAAAAAPAGYTVRAIGDSVTAGFGYCGTNDTVCGGPQDSLMSVLALPACASGPLVDQCSSNFDNPTGVGSRVSWALQFAQAEGIQNFDNFAVQGSTPADWDTGGQLNGTLQQVAQANPNLTLMTLGANPILGQFAYGGALPCILLGTDTQVRQCANQLLAQNDTVAHLQNVYTTLIQNTQTHVVVLLYHNPVPLLAAALSLRHKVAIVLQQINDAVTQAATTVGAQFPGRITVLTPGSSPWSYGHQCTPVQALLVYEWLKSDGQHGLAPRDVSTPWVLTNDSCIHPTIAGYQQFTASLTNWFESQGPGRQLGALLPLRPLLQLSYRSVQIGSGRPRIQLTLGHAARVTIAVGSDRCLQQQIKKPRACGKGSANRVRLRPVTAFRGRAGARTVTLPVGQGYFQVQVTATARRGRQTQTLELVQLTRRSLLVSLRGVKPR